MTDTTTNKPDRRRGKGRGNSERSAEMRGELIAAGRRLFAEKGFADTSTPEIVAAAGVTRGALYHHFADKAALFAAVFEAESREVAREIEDGSSEAASAREALLAGYAWSRVLEMHGARMVSRDFAPGFKARLHRKDLRIVTDTAAQLDIALPQAALIAQHLNALVGMGCAEEDSAAVVKVLERMSGVTDQ